MIFLHSSFRTASTYLWSCFRKAPRTVAYCEIFHEALNILSPADVAAFKPDGWHSKHPAGAPYFLEYVPVLRDGGGVERFDPSMSYERFIPAGGCSCDVSAMEADYVRGLINHAERRGKIPVLTATRSLGRAAGLKRAFPGLHALVYRNLFQQWCSFTEQAFRGNPYFLERVAEVTRLHRSDPVLGALHQMFPIERVSAEDANMFYAFTFLHLYLYTQAAGAMDLVIDVNRLEVDLPYRKQVEDRVAAEDIALDLSGTKNTIAYSICELGSKADFSEKIGVIGSMVIDQAPDGAGREFGIKVMSDLMEEHARHDFQANGLRSVLLGPGGLRAERDAARFERDMGVEKQNGLRAELHAARAEAGAARAERDQAASERDALRIEHAAALAEAGAARAERDGLASERDGLRAEYVAALALAEAEAGAARAERDQAASERDALRIERAAALTETGAARKERDGLASERDGLRAGLDAAMAEAGAARAERDKLASEHDGLRAEYAAALALAEAEAGAARTERDGLASERDGLRAELDAALAEAGAARAERDQLAARCAALDEWAQADRDAVLASLSWRLTRPLRRLGIGRANRPSRQDWQI